jgi:hypothetical protein
MPLSGGIGGLFNGVRTRNSGQGMPVARVYLYRGRLRAFFGESELRKRGGGGGGEKRKFQEPF